MVTKVKPNIHSFEVHPQLSNNGHPVDGVLVGAGSLCLSDYGNWIGGCIKLQKKKPEQTPALPFNIKN